MTIAVISLGCPKNLVDTEVMLGLLDERGHLFSADVEGADIVIVNTCSFISAAVAESLDVIEECVSLKREGRVGRVVVAGCLPQRYGRSTWEMSEGVDGVIGCSDVQHIVDAVDAVFEGKRVEMISEPRFLYDEGSPRVLGTPGHLAYVKIAEGCDNRCSYCTIPGIRGRLRSREPASVVREVEELAGLGVREVNLIAQDTSAYGTDIATGVTLAGLLEALDGSTVPWIRVLYAHPAHITQELLETISAVPVVVPYLDIPIQHVSDRMLAAMRRHVTGGRIRALFRRAREVIPGLAIRSSVMVGFPGETEEEFAELLAFVSSGAVDHLGVFEYSPEKGTPAAALPGQVDSDIAASRAGRLVDAMEQLTAARNQHLVGEVATVLVDEVDEGDGPSTIGRTVRQAWEMDGVVRLVAPSHDVMPGDFVEIRITGADGFDLLAEGLPGGSRQALTGRPETA